ncbi:hypothetical protein MBH78_18275 [Oceanimonas sp. NS1]|nr:hypothetical protein [Oceanimonas sp. NS1]
MNALLSLLPRYRRQHPLSFRLFLLVIVVSLGFTLASTAVQLWLDHRKINREMDERLLLIEHSYLDSLSRSLWDLNLPQARLQLESMLDMPHMASLTVTGDGLAAPLTLSKGPERDGVNRHGFDLVYPSPALGPQQVGRLEVAFSRQSIRHQLMSRARSILLGQSLTVLLIALSLMLVFQRRVTRHLERMARNVAQIGEGHPDTAPLNLARPPIPCPTNSTPWWAPSTPCAGRWNAARANCSTTRPSSRPWSTGAPSTCARPRKRRKPPTAPRHALSPT